MGELNSRRNWVVGSATVAATLMVGFAVSNDRATRLFSSPSGAQIAERATQTERERQLEHAVIPASTPIRLELLHAVSSQSAELGDEVVAGLAEPIRIGSEVVILAGARVTGRVTEVHALRRIGGQAVLEVTFDRLEWRTGGTEIAARFRREAENETEKDAKTIATGATIGSILGNQTTKDDRGRLIGAVVGAVAATAVASQTPGRTVELPAGSQLLLRLGANSEVAFERG